MPVMRGNSSGVRPGFIGKFAFDDTDPAWIDCDGRDLNVTDEPALFAAIGYTWGGAGAVFKAPAMVDDFARGAGPGRPVGTRELQSERAHTHALPAAINLGDAGFEGPIIGVGGGSTGAAVMGAGETRPRNVAVKFRIKR